MQIQMRRPSHLGAKLAPFGANPKNVQDAYTDICKALPGNATNVDVGMLMITVQCCYLQEGSDFFISAAALVDMIHSCCPSDTDDALLAGLRTASDILFALSTHEDSHASFTEEAA